MAILWCGGEDIDFTCADGFTITTDTARFRSTYSRCAVMAGAKEGIMYSPTFSSQTSAWLSLIAYPPTIADGVAYRYFGLGASGTTKGIYVGALGAYPRIMTFDGTTETVLATSTSKSFDTGTRARFDLQVSNYGSSGTVNLYQNGVLIATYTGDITISGVTGFDCVYNKRTSISEVIVSDTDTRNIIGLKTLAPTSDGTTTDWTGTYADVDETTISDADANYTDTTDLDQQFNVTDLPAGTFYISSVKIACRATKSEDASIGKIKLGWKNGATTAVGTAQSLTTEWATYEELDALDPTTSAAWAQADMNDLELTVRSET